MKTYKNLLDGITKKRVLVLVAFVVVAILLGVAGITRERREAGRVPVVMGGQVFIEELEAQLRSTIDDSVRVTVKDNELEATISSSVKYPFLAGATVRFENEGDPEALVKNLIDAIAAQFPGNVALEKKLLIVDMRFENKVYFGFEE